MFPVDFQNAYTQILSFSELLQLVKLDLQHNELQQIPRCLLELPSLTELNLSHNQLQEIPDIPEWSASLTALDLSYNCLESLPPSVVASSICKLNIACRQSVFLLLPLCKSLTSLEIKTFSPYLLTESLPHFLQLKLVLVLTLMYANLLHSTVFGKLYVCIHSDYCMFIL